MKKKMPNCTRLQYMQFEEAYRQGKGISPAWLKKWCKGNQELLKHFFPGDYK